MKQPEEFARQVFSLSPAILEEAYSTYCQGNKQQAEIIKQVAAFNRQSGYQPESVAVDKLKLPPGGTVHDYYSQAPYWFPDPASSDGLPYIRKDGEFNPEAVASSSDHQKMKRMVGNIYISATLFFFTSNTEIGTQASGLLRHWFLDPATFMKPHLNFGQAIPGINTGRDAGIIETHIFIKVIDAVTMLKNSPHWTTADELGMKNWLYSYLDWLRHSEIGLAESKAPNNHGAWYNAMAMKLAAYCGREEIFQEHLARIKKLIKLQICPDGSMPEELQRTQAWGYSIFGLSAFLVAATVAADYGDDLFNYRTDDGIGIRTALDFLVGFAAGDKRWPFSELYGFAPEKLTPALLIAARNYHDDGYSRVLNRLPPYDSPADRLFFP